MDNSDIRTGDALIFCSNTPTGFALRTFTSSMWNHSGIAIRMNENKEITQDGTGKLYVLEINTFERVDALTGELTIGAGFSDYNWVVEKYNIACVRKMRDEYRNKIFVDNIVEFIHEHRGYEFTSDVSPFLSVWLGIELENKVKNKMMFCSEFMAHFYMKCLSVKITDVLGKYSPCMPSLCAPKHFSTLECPGSVIFENIDHRVHIKYSSMSSILIPVLIITAFIIVVIILTL